MIELISLQNKEKNLFYTWLKEILKVTGVLCLCFILLTGCVTVKDERKQISPPSPDAVQLVTGGQDLHDALQTLLAQKQLENSSVGIKIIGLSGNKVLYAKNSRKLFHPASTMKLFTTAAALTHMGPGYSFATTLMLEEGALRNGTLHGDVFLVGSGDPSLSSADLADLASQLYSLGVRRINGNIVCDDSLFDTMRYGKGWMWDDQPYKDFAPLSALSVDRNTVRIYVKPGERRGQSLRVRTSPETNFLDIVNHGYTSSSARSVGLISHDEDFPEPLSVLRRWQKQDNIIDITGAMDINSPEREYVRNIVNPTLYCGNLFRQQCVKAGISLRGGIVRGGTSESAVQVAVHKSAPLSLLISEMNKESYNIYAELLLKSLGAHVYGGAGTAEKGLQVVNDMLMQWGSKKDSFSFADGSGVSRYGLLSPDTLCLLLAKVYDDFAIRHEFIASLAVPGTDGTLEERMQEVYNSDQVHAKTGSMRGVSVLAGVTESYSGEPLGVVIMMEHFVGSHKPFHDIQDRVFDLLNRFTE